MDILVSISNGYIIVGAWGDDDDGTDSGAAYIFESPLVEKEAFSVINDINSDNNGYIGIGTNNPKGALHIYQTENNNPVESGGEWQDGVNMKGLVLSYEGGYNSGDLGAEIRFGQEWWGGSPGSIVYHSGIQGYKQLATNNYGGGLKFYTSNGHTIINTMTLDAYGKVGIGIEPQGRITC